MIGMISERCGAADKDEMTIAMTSELLQIRIR